MKICIKLTIILSLIVFNNIFSTECSNPFISKVENPNRVYFGLDIAGITLDTSAGNVCVEGSNFFAGINLGYEYRCPEAFYFSAQAELLGSDHGFKASLNDNRLDPRHDQPSFAIFELQLGYTKQYGNWLITPYGGVGSLGISSNHDHEGFDEMMAYFLFGFRGNYGFSERYDLGFILEFFRSYHMRTKFRTHQSTARSRVENPGVYFSLPITMHFGSCLQWDAQFEPYIRAISIGEKQLMYGMRFNIGYSF